jgi:hypothetical protein
MNPALKQLLIASVASIVAIRIGFELANGSYFWPSVALFVATTAVLTRIYRLPIDVILLGMVLFGYLVGNRGFAQLTVTPGIPLFPAEFVLAIAAGWALIACGFEKRLPIRNNALNWFVLAWLIAGSARIVMDVREYGVNALRDFATVYYAVFFFIVQRVAAQPAARQYLLSCLIAGLLLLPPLSALADLLPGLLEFIRVRGVPVLLYKGDLAFMFQAVGAVVLFHWARGRHRYWAWPYSVVLFLLVLARESRASILGAIVTILLTMLARRWLYPLVQSTSTAVAAIIVITIAVFTNNAWAHERLDRLQAHLRSIVSPVMLVSHHADESAYKWDNNRFRLIWWRSVIYETQTENPVFGLGFGHDLARNFVQEYSPDITEEFSARSPHSISITALGRMGAIGFVIWTALSIAILHATWRALRYSRNPLQWGLWCGVIVVLVAANFGVVLEGPMGAVPFWIMLALAEAAPPEAPEVPNAMVAPEATPPAAHGANAA